MLLLRAAVQRCTATTRRRLAAQNRPSASAARTTAPWASFAEFLDAADEERAATRPATTDTWSCPAPADVPPEPTVSYAASFRPRITSERVALEHLWCDTR